MVVKIMKEGMEINLKTQECSGCGRKIIFGQTEAGKFMPLDVVAPVYRVEVTAKSIDLFRSGDSFVSHFCTCPKAGEFSKKGKEAEAKVARDG